MTPKYRDVEVAYTYLWEFDPFIRELVVVREELSRSFIGSSEEERVSLRVKGAEEFIWERELST